MSTACVNAGSGTCVYPPAGPSAIVTVANAIRAFGERLEQRQRLRADRNRLLSLPDGMLKDIGIARSEIDFAVKAGRDIDRIRARQPY